MRLQRIQCRQHLRFKLIKRNAILRLEMSDSLLTSNNLSLQFADPGMGSLIDPRSKQIISFGLGQIFQLGDDLVRNGLHGKEGKQS